jgi:hypothetical protein
MTPIVRSSGQGSTIKGVSMVSASATRSRFGRAALVAVVGLAVLMLLVKLRLVDLDLIREATGEKASLAPTEDGKGPTTEGSQKLGVVIDKISTYAVAAGFGLIPVGAAFGGIAWLVGSPKGPRHVITVVGAGLLIGSTGLIVA